MKSKKRIDYGLNSFHVATIPKAPRSIRRRAQLKKAEDDICAFELLASLAKKLQKESESSSPSSNASGNDHVTIGKDAVKGSHHYEYKPLKTECLDQGSSELSAVVSESASQNCVQKCSLNEFPLAEDDEIMERTSKIMDSDFSGKNGGDLKSAIFKSNSANENIPSKGELEGGSPNFGESCYSGMPNTFEHGFVSKGLETRLNMDKKCSLSSPTKLAVTYPASINSVKDVKMPSRRDPAPYTSFSRQRNHVKLAVRDDNDNLIRGNKFSSKLKVYRPVTHIGDRRIRKFLTSRYWKVASKLKDFELSRADGGIKPPHRKRKTCLNHERRQRDIFYKWRKFHNLNSLETFDGGFSSESVTKSPGKGRKGDKMLQGASGVTSSVGGQQASLHSKDSNVKFCIKSFRVPEIFIEVSETATLASLKRIVMDTVTATLGGGIRVGVLLHGKKIRNDNRTLSQSGISSEDSLNSLGFTLEPISVLDPSPVCSEDPPLLLPCNIPRLVPRVLAPVRAMDVDALAVVPGNQKNRRSEIAQRRTRRPFSVSEVEALVQAVEEHGTGRWRDIKLRSFEHVDHRTYVDLKDKWKTLVHTAKISPTRRRGEAVPQELLDRVLAAHTYWTEHQAKQQGKHESGILNENGSPG